MRRRHPRVGGERRANQLERLGRTAVLLHQYAAEMQRVEI
jgi:hypothetical protein